MRIRSEPEIRDLIFNLHRCIETRDWKSAKAFFADASLEETLSREFGPLEVPERIIGTELKISFEMDGSVGRGVILVSNNNKRGDQNEAFWEFGSNNGWLKWYRT